MAMYDVSGGKFNRSGNVVQEGEMDALLLGKTKELVAATPSQKNWAGIIISLLVICAVCGLILFSIYLLRPPDDGERVRGRKIFINDTTSPKLNYHPFNGSFISQNELIFRDYLGGLSILNVDTLIQRPFVSNSTFRQLDAKKYSVSPDRQFVLLVHELIPKWDYSYSAKYTIYDIANEHKFSLSPFSNGSRENEVPFFEHVEWGPFGNALVLVHLHDIYYMSTAKDKNIIRITTNGVPSVYFNGLPDWLYEVEILKSKTALWMSPNGKILLYASFDDSNVGEMSYPWYADNLPYPKLRSLRYPKVGTPNPVVTLWAVDLNSLSFISVPLTPPSELVSRDHYVTGVKWVDSSTVSVVWMNRDQNSSFISLCSHKTEWKCQNIYSVNVKPEGSGWLSPPPPPIFSPDLNSCLLLIPWRDGTSGYFTHVIYYEIEGGKEIAVSQGPFEVTEIAAWDHKNNLVYFIGVPVGKPGERHLYKISQKSSNLTTSPIPTCLSCPPLSLKEKSQKHSWGSYGNNRVLMNPLDPSSPYLYFTSTNSSNVKTIEDIHCLYNRVIFSPTSDFYVSECLGPGIPTVSLHEAQTGKLLTVLDESIKLKNRVGELGVPIVRIFQVEVPDGYHAPVRLFLPPGFREHEDFKFPLLLHVGGEAGSQLVDEKWGLSWASYLCSQKNFIVAEIDGRGTGFQGNSLRHSVYKKIGKIGIQDQIEVIKYLRDRLSFIDKDNMGVYGEGYGGYAALLILASDNYNLFRCAISISPITKWEFYNTFHVEKLFGLVNNSDNFRVYEEGDVTKIVKELKNKKFLIIHGTADEKVHYQHTLHLTKELIKEGVSFTEQIYPDEGHSYSGVSEHLYLTMEAYLDQNFDLPDWKDFEKANFLGVKI